MPFDVAFCLSLEERLAFVLALGRLDGHDFDVAAMRWKEAKR